MKKEKKQKIVITVIAVLLILFVILVVAAMTKTGNNEMSYELGTTDQVAQYTLPEDYTQQSENSIQFLTPTTDRVVSNEARYAFSGTCDGKYDLYCNQTPVAYNSNGVFTCEFPLSQGENVFVFTYGSITKTFVVEYGIDIIRQVAPQGKTETTPGVSIEILALAHREATVYAQIAGQRISMERTDRNAFQQSEGTKDYATFAGYYTMPATSTSQSLGTITVYGMLNGKTASMQGGEIVLISDQSAILQQAVTLEQQQNLTSFYLTGTHGLLQPTADYGLGTAMMCEVLKDKAETTPASDPNDYSSPLFTPLARGTFDYVSSIVTYDDELTYILSSGRKIYAKEARLIPTGYVLPMNTVSASDIVVTGNTTDYYISTKWAVPVNGILSPQGYYTGYQGRIYNVTAFTAEYLDITFYYTDGFNGGFTLPTNDVLSSMQWINNGDHSVTLRCYLTTPGQFYGYSISLGDDGRFKLSIKNKHPAAGKTVILDPGHGGSDPGAGAIYDGIYESPINLAIAAKVASILQSQGIHVVMTRTAESDVTLNERMLMARQYMPDAYVSIHCDSSTSASTSGTHTFYYESFSMPLAASIHNQMVGAYRYSLYPSGSTEYNHADKQIKFYPFQVTRVEECPSVLVECGYLSNATDCSILLTDACQNILATAIANGIILYFNNQG